MKKHLCQIIFVQIKSNENIFTIRVWRALIEEVASTSAMAAGAAGVLRLYFRFPP